MTVAVSAQVSLYPLRQMHLSPAIRRTLEIFEKHGLEVRAGPMSTVIWGDEETVFRALEEAFREASLAGQVVMAVTLSNACPLPGPEA